LILKLGGEVAALCDAVGVVIVVRCLDWTRTYEVEDVGGALGSVQNARTEMD